MKDTAKRQKQPRAQRPNLSEVLEGATRILYLKRKVQTPKVMQLFFQDALMWPRLSGFRPGTFSGAGTHGILFSLVWEVT